MTISNEEIKDHVGHQISCVSYGNGQNYSIVCDTCSMILFEWDQEMEFDVDKNPYQYSISLLKQDKLVGNELLLSGTIFKLLSIHSNKNDEYYISTERQNIVLEHIMKVNTYTEKYTNKKTRKFKWKN